MVYALNRRHTSILLDILKQGLAAGEVLPQVNPKMVRDLVYGAIEHLAWRMVNGDGVLKSDAVARQLSAVVLTGRAAPRRLDPRHGR